MKCNEGSAQFRLRYGFIRTEIFSMGVGFVMSHVSVHRTTSGYDETEAPPRTFFSGLVSLLSAIIKTIF